MTKIQEKYKTMMEEEAKRFLSNARGNIQHILQNATLSLMGLERRGSSDFEIDHCNGRNSVLIEAFRNYAKAEAEKLARTYKPSKEDIVNFQKTFKGEYERQIRYAMETLAKEKARKDAEEYLSRIKMDITEFLNPTK